MDPMGILKDFGGMTNMETPQKLKIAPGKWCSEDDPFLSGRLFPSLATFWGEVV